MFVRCTRCALAFSAPDASAACPRCGAPTPPRELPPTRAAPAYAPATARTDLAPPAPHRTEVAPPPPGAWSPPRVLARAAAPAATEDRGAIAGRAAVAAALSALAVVGCCNPLGWVGILASLSAYAKTDEPDLAPAAARARRALWLGWLAFGSTAALWGVSLTVWWFDL
ncbi:MAG: hypothetical protein R3A48_12725 [Polyangiales bacterium]